MYGAFDFETWEWVNPLCVSFAYGDLGDTPVVHYKVDMSKKNPLALSIYACKYMAESGVPVWWAHNAGRFDALLLLQAITAMGWKFTASLSGTRIISMQVFPSFGGKFQIRDSYAVVQAPLAKICEDFELKAAKKFVKGDYKGDMRDLPLEKLKEGCVADSLAVFELIGKVWQLFHDWGGELKSTFSSSALTVARAAAQEEGFEFPDIPHAVNRTAKESYCGGRVEIFHHCPGQIEAYDLNSSYPASMVKTLPWEYLGEATKTGLMKIFEGRHEGLLECTVTVPECEIPPLPVRTGDGDLFFPTGTFRGWYAAPEIRYAAEQGAKIKLHHGLIYSSGKPFEKFINKVYQTKCEAKGAVRMFAKLVLNGSYGKFGEGEEKETLKFFPSLDEAMAQTLLKAGKPMDDRRFVAFTHNHMPEHTNYALAAYVTAYSRITLHQALVASKAFYCDTDSAHCRNATFPIGDKLGEWKKEYTGKGFYYAPKLYAIKGGEKDVYASKGFKITAEEFDAVVKGGEVPFHYLTGLKSMLRRGNGFERISLVKRWKGESTKRKTLRGGKTRPWTMGEILEGVWRKQKSYLFAGE